MRTSIKARLGAVAAAAAIATTGAIAASGVADAASAHPAARLSTALSIKASAPVTVRHVTFDRIKGQLTSGIVPLRFKVVWLERREMGHWVVAQREFTNRRGVVVYGVRERRTHSFRLVFHGTPNFKRAVSAVITIKAGS